MYGRMFVLPASGALSIFLILNASSCLAASDDASEQDFLQELPVVLSASRLSQPLADAPNAVTVIDRAMIKAAGFRKIADLFKMVPGMYVDYQDGYTPIVSYHGATDIYTRRMQVLVDGRSVYQQPFNTVDWEDLPLHLDDIERIEVVRGPAATSFGSNSILGVINITTRDASALSGASLSVQRGNEGVADVAAHFGGGGERLDYRFTLGRRADNGLSFPAGTPTYYNVSNDGSSTNFANLRGNFHPGGGDSIDFQMGLSQGVRNAGYSGLPIRPISPLREMKSSSDYEQLSWLHTLSGSDDIQLRYNHTARLSMDERQTRPDGGWQKISYLISDNVSAHRHEIELQHTLHTSQNNRLVWGAAMRRESVDSVSMFASKQVVQQSRGFVNDEWRVSPKTVLNGGSMLESSGFGHTRLSPRAAINYHLAPGHTIRAGVSIAYRNPALVEERGNQHYYFPDASFGGNRTIGLYQEFQSYGGLRPERAFSREVGYLGKLSGGWSVDMRVYNDQVSDIIWIDYVLVPGSIKETMGFPVAWGFRNDFAANYSGLEGALKYEWADRKHSLTLSFSHQKVSCDPIGTPYLGNHPILGGVAMDWYASMVQAYTSTVPTNSGSLLYSGQLDEGIMVSAGYYQHGAVMVLDANLPQPLNRRVDVRVAKQFGPASIQHARIGGGEVALVLQNVFQDNNVGYSGYIFDRRAYLTATVNF